jgi:hypothetical protein
MAQRGLLIDEAIVTERGYFPPQMLLQGGGGGGGQRTTEKEDAGRCFRSRKVLQ